MVKNLFELINDKDIKNLGMEVLSKGKDYDGPNQYIQICDKGRLLDDKKYICHYEILYMGKDDLEYGSHENNKIYVEIHFENKKFSPLFQSVVSELLKNKKLESFYWRDYCPGLRLKNCVFTVKDKKRFLQTCRN